ncbi:MAG: hypothetical protein IPP49_18945 [Saprospiraceae bacterium]|nr:hypothetical protein [Saprospiraceae bacterium]
MNPSYPNGTVLKDGRIVFVDFNPVWPTGLNALRCLDTITKKNDWMFIYPFQQSWGRKLYTVKQLKNGDIICTGKYTTKASTPRIRGSSHMIRLKKMEIRYGSAYVEIVPDGKIKVFFVDVVELENGDPPCRLVT